jgi:hypothetical protein
LACACGLPCSAACRIVSADSAKTAFADKANKQIQMIRTIDNMAALLKEKFIISCQAFKVNVILFGNSYRNSEAHSYCSGKQLSIQLCNAKVVYNHLNFHR